MQKRIDPKRQAQKDHKEVFQAVQAILLKHWDPLGIKSEPEAPQEYGPYISQVVFLAKTGASVADIAGHLAHLETTQMGLSGKAPKRWARCRESGEAVVAYFKYGK